MSSQIASDGGAKDVEILVHRHVRPPGMCLHRGLRDRSVSFILLGIASLRARVLPTISGIALIVAGGITLLPLPIDGPAFEVVIGLAFALAGLLALPRRLPAPLATRPAA